MRCNAKGKMEGVELAKTISSKFGTTDVFEIARRSDISITYAKWFPVTLGELDKKNRRITVNENARIPFEKIIAHELGHYFLEEFEPRRRGNAETICDEFAHELLKND